MYLNHKLVQTRTILYNTQNKLVQTQNKPVQTQCKLNATKTRGKKNNNPYLPTQTSTQQPTKINNHRNRDTFHSKLGHAN